jgi:phytoene dehydrogenase-like protein
MVAMGRFVKPILGMQPPDPTSLSPSGLKQLLGCCAVSAAAAAGPIQPGPADDDERGRFSRPVVRDRRAQGDDVGVGHHRDFLGVRSPGTAYVLLHHYMGEIDGAFRSWGLARGGTGAISNAIADAARGAGVEIRTTAPVSSILVRGTRAEGVVLENGDEIRASVVASSVDPRHTFQRFLEPDLLPDDFVEDIRRYKFRGSSAKVNLALDALPDFTALPGPGPHLRGAISISPSVDYMERAYDDAKYGRFSRRPYMDIVIPSLTDTSLAPPGKHVMSCFVQYAPYHLREGTWDDQREALGDAVIDTIAEYAPNIRNIVRHRQVVTPLDLEREWSLSEGNIFQGELTLEQLFFLRPAPGWARYRTPIDNLYMCGSATHPGGGIMGAPGRNAAMRILADKRL